MRQAEKTCFFWFCAASIAFASAVPSLAADTELQLPDGRKVTIPTLTRTYEVELEDGRKVTVEAQVGASDQEVREAVRRKFYPTLAERRAANKAQIDEERSRIYKEEAQRRKDNPELYERRSDRMELYRNCIIDKMAGVTDETAQQFVQYSCIEIAKDPSLYQKWKYSD